MKWDTFRDRLIPGQKEEWRLTITKPDGTPADASMLAVLYDKSLDALYAHNWSFTPKAYYSTPSSMWRWKRWYSGYASGSKEYHSLQIIRTMLSR